MAAPKDRRTRNSRARSRALIRLTQAHRVKYQKFYDEWIAQGYKWKVAQGKSRIELSKAFPDEFQKLYLEAKQEMPLDDE